MSLWMSSEWVYKICFLLSCVCCCHYRHPLLQWYLIRNGLDWNVWSSVLYRLSSLFVVTTITSQASFVGKNDDPPRIGVNFQWHQMPPVTSIRAFFTHSPTRSLIQSQRLSRKGILVVYLLLRVWLCKSSSCPMSPLINILIHRMAG